jgi:hypothetical protein
MATHASPQTLLKMNETRKQLRQQSEDVRADLLSWRDRALLEIGQLI